MTLEPHPVVGGLTRRGSKCYLKARKPWCRWARSFLRGVGLPVVALDGAHARAHDGISSSTNLRSRHAHFAAGGHMASHSIWTSCTSVT